MMNSENAATLKQSLLDLSRQPENQPFKTILRIAADSIRNLAFGYNREVTRKKILKLLNTENNGYDCLEIDDFVDETKLPEDEIRAALDELIETGLVEQDKRRRWQEPGKHYNDIFRIRK